MIYYLEFIFLENLFVNFIIMYMVKIFTKINKSNMKIMFSSFFCSMYVLILLIYNINNSILKLLTSFFVVYITFEPKSLKNYVKLIIYYLFLEYLYSGIIIGLTLILNINVKMILVKILIYIISAIILYIINSYMWKMWKLNINNDNLTYIINIGGQEIYGYVDTGNLAKNIEYNTDIIFLDKKWFGVLYEKGMLNHIVKTNILSINGENVSIGYMINNIKIYKNPKKIITLKKIIISFSSQDININGKYTALIGYNTFCENLGGIYL